MRLDKLLADMQVGTRSEVKKYIKSGLVTVNGIPAKAVMDVAPGEDCVTFQGKEIEYRPYEYYMFHKPVGCVTARKDNLHKSVMDFIKDGRKDLSPVGRLDLDTTGLLFITNDGKLGHELLSPKKHVKKLYEVKVKGRVTAEDVRLFREGLDIGDDTPTKPAELTILKEGEESLVRVSLTEGRFHQVKRMFLAVGKEVLTLKRLAMGSLTLDESLQPGEYRKLTEEEVAKLKGLEEVLC
ncbi:MAG: rRNA pseudouridine synthase [Roseburia sp.]|nr:rRNA pseudouridine synthase [Roseburia sp.]